MTLLIDRFGFGLTSLGDINRDGYEDIAVGAPYEGRGAVYVYLGSRDGLITKHGQVSAGIRSQCIRSITVPRRKREERTSPSSDPLHVQSAYHRYGFSRSWYICLRSTCDAGHDSGRHIAVVSSFLRYLIAIFCYDR